MALHYFIHIDFNIYHWRRLQDAYYSIYKTKYTILDTLKKKIFVYKIAIRQQFLTKHKLFLFHSFN